MRIIEIAAMENGAHRNQLINTDIQVPDGWAIVPDDITIPDTYPFVGIATENGVVTSMTAGTIPAPVTPSLAEVQADKLAELNAACDAAIVSGCAVTLSDGTVGHISLTLPDQINLSTAQAAILAGGSGYAYHLDGALCEIYPAADIAIMAQAATDHILYHQTYCNHVRAWVKRCEAVAEVQAITYGAELPDDLAAHMTAVLAAAEGSDA